MQRTMEGAHTGVQVVDRGATASIEDVVPDVVHNERLLVKAVEAVTAVQEENVARFDALPGISRTGIESGAKLLTIKEKDPPLQGYRCFLAISEMARRGCAEFFFQPHRTSVVWGGQRVLFVFLHHSEELGLYYDLLTHETLAKTGGGGPYPTCSIILKDKIYVPIPEKIAGRFIPQGGERKRFLVRHDILRVGGSGDWRGDDGRTED